MPRSSPTANAKRNVYEKDLRTPNKLLTMINTNENEYTIF